MNVVFNNVNQKPPGGGGGGTGRETGPYMSFTLGMQIADQRDGIRYVDKVWLTLHLT